MAEKSHLIEIRRPIFPVAAEDTQGAALNSDDSAIRRDIQFLRGIAVLFVVIFHADVGLESGFLGVDVFFVLSGFLVASIILRALADGTFTFGAFYLRRAKRLLPALYCTLLVTGALSYTFVAETQRTDFIHQMLGALFYSANMVLATQSGYFDGAAESKPLLHIWSLSLEEQYYFALPLLLFLLKKEWRLVALVLLTLLSFAWCVVWSTSTDAPPVLWRFSKVTAGEWAFFLLPTRAWELLVGSICALVALRRPPPLPKGSQFAALMIIGTVGVVGFDSVHPRGDALLVALATGLIVLGRDEWLPNTGLVRAVERIGDASYSIYLVHWPLFVFAFLGFAGSVPTAVHLGLIPLSIFVGFLQYRLIEQPFRYGWRDRPGVASSVFAGSTVAVVALPAHLAFAMPADLGPDFGEIRRRNYGLSEQCNVWLEHGLPAACQQGEAPKIAVWGDSFAMHLVPALASRYGEILQVTKSVCGPLADVAPVYARYSADWAEHCIRFNRKALDLILAHPTVTHVVLSSSMHQYLSGFGQMLSGGAVLPMNAAVATEALVRTIRAIREAGKTPIVVTPPPRNGIDIGECIERESNGLTLFLQDCEIRTADFHAYDAQVLSILEAVKRASGERVISLGDVLCDHTFCKTRINGVILYRDSGHLTVDGSAALAHTFDIY